eukprot:9674025-Ditylum_brightwellii.AAC.1
MTSTVPGDPISARFEEEESRSVSLVSTSAMDDGASGMYWKNTGYDLFSISSRQARLIALFDIKRKSEISMVLPDVSNALGDMLFIDALEGTRHMASATTVKSNKETVDAVELAKRWEIGMDTARETLGITTQK